MESAHAQSESARALRGGVERPEVERDTTLNVLCGERDHACGNLL
jgi:hypothetical protein